MTERTQEQILSELEMLIAERIRPSILLDGGDIVFYGFKDGVVLLELQGACVGCASSTITLKHGIENMLKHYVPEVKEVRSILE
jgi:Fe-S cluster biogenesis protein NfuA